VIVINLAFKHIFIIFIARLLRSKRIGVLRTKVHGLVNAITCKAIARAPISGDEFNLINVAPVTVCTM